MRPSAQLDSAAEMIEDTGTWWSAIASTAAQVFSPTFWRGMLTPWRAVARDPGLALKAAGIAGGAVLAAGLGIIAAPAALGAGAAVAKPAVSVGGFALRHPILSWIAIANAELPTEVVRGLAAYAMEEAAVPPTLPPAVPSVTPRATTPIGPVRAVSRPAVRSEGDAWNRLMRGETVPMSALR